MSPLLTESEIAELQEENARLLAAISSIVQNPGISDVINALARRGGDDLAQRSIRTILSLAQEVASLRNDCASKDRHIEELEAINEFQKKAEEIGQ